MTELLTAAQMRAIEQAAIGSGEVTGLELMERAGRGVVEAIFEEWPELAKTSHRAVVLCGPGNNGGDGFVVARLLKAWGWEVGVFLHGDPARLPPDARVNRDRWTELGEVRPLEEAPKWSGAADLFIDALFGTGLARALDGAAVNWVADRTSDPEWPSKTVAIDVPSGLCSDSGRELGGPAATIRADLTVTFHRLKAGHVLDRGPLKCGRVVVKDIGLNTRSSGASAPARPRSAPEGRGETAPILGPVANLVSRDHVDLHRLAKSGGHKYDQGHALILSGPPGAGGAARLAARGALRIGAGLVSVACEKAAVAEHAAHLTAIMIRRVDGAGALAALLEDRRFNALCLGPGLGVDRARELVPLGLAAPHRPAVVLDADALTAYAGDPQALFAMLGEGCVLTPHAGEFARLFPDIAGTLNATPTRGPAYSKLDATREAAKRAGCVVLFKGPDTVIAAPDGRCSVNPAAFDRAAPWLATAGSGDVLAGFITGLLARGFDPMRAAETAAWLHVECARSFGPGLIAEDIPEELPGVFRALGL